MTTMICLSCTAETSNGLALCEMCQMKAAKMLEFIPVYFRNLSRWRPGRAGARPVPGSRVLYDGEARTGGDDRVSRALDEAGAAIAKYVADFHRDRGPWLPEIGDDESQTVGASCRFLAGHLASIGTLTWCGDFVTGLDQHERRLSALTEQVVPGWYAGGCRREIADGIICDSGVYVVPGLTWVTCKACGVTTYARDHLNNVLDEARDWVARPKALAEAIVALVDGEQSVPRLLERIKKWAQRGKILPYRKIDTDGDTVGPKRYRLGDVLDLVLMRGSDASERIGA